MVGTGSIWELMDCEGMWDFTSSSSTGLNHGGGRHHMLKREPQEEGLGLSEKRKGKGEKLGGATVMDSM